MDAAFKIKNENPRRKANIISKLFFGWIIKLFYTGTQRSLKLEDLYETLECDESERLGDKLEQKWKDENLKAKQRNDYKPSLLKAIIRTFCWQYFAYGLSLFLLQVVLRSPQPVVLSFLIRQFQVETIHDRTTMYASAGVLVSISLLSVLINHHNNYGQCCVGMRVRIAVSSLVYRKIMRLNKRSQGQTAAGQVVNLLANDVQRFDQVAIFLHFLWIMPFQVALVTYFLWEAIGISCLAGILSIALCTLPVQGYLGKLTSYLRLKMAQRTDERVKQMSEIISGIQVIKMYAWEKPFENLINFLRIKEINVLTKASYLRGFYLSCMVFIERSTLFLTILCYTLLGNHIKADIVFSMAQFFNILQSAMAIFYPMAISIGAETLVSIERLEEILVLEEKQQAKVEETDKSEVIIKKVSASWVPDNLVLNNVSLHIPQGCLCAVIGPVGAGKSTLLQLLLGEIPATTGQIKLGGDISYASQEPWLFASSVRKNILFGKPYSHQLYKEVANVCALERDFEQFPFGDRTLVGERGVSLSGGQRARINLARAIYRQADLYLLDDPLSAVDTHVGKHLFDKCIVKYLKGKTRILVTHQLQYLKKADLIVVLNEGRIEAKGTFKELSNRDLDFTKMLASADETTEEKDKEKKEKERSVEISYGSGRRFSLMSSDSQSLEKSIRDEENEETSELVGSSALWEYIKSVGNCCLVLLVILVLLLSQTACTVTDLWVALWTSQEELHYSNSTQIVESSSPLEQVDVYLIPNSTVSDQPPINNTSSNYYSYNQTASRTNHNLLNFNLDDIFDHIQTNGVTHLFFKTKVAIIIYGSLILVMIALTVARSFLFFKVAMKTSKNIHRKMFHGLLEAPMRFFDVNPSGRVLNRFSKDMGAIDEVLPRVLMESIQIILVMSGILVTVVISNYYMILAILILGTIFLKLRSWYVASARDIKHLEGIAKSPVFSHVNSTLNGLTTIRAAQAEKMLMKEFDEHQNVHTSAWFLTIMCTVSFGLWLDLICVIFITCVTFGFVIAADYGAYENGSLVGLAISQSLILTGMLQYGMRQTAEVVNQLTSVERVLQYTKLEKEGPFETPKDVILPILSWPSMGKIEFKKLYLTYAPEHAPVLKDLNFIIEAGEKVGIVGRTGAGKSSLISALFRLAPTKGHILIDDLDTKTVGLNDLRKKISIIPQEPVLFSATLRYNLDPFSEFEDDKLWAALEEVELKDLVTTLDFQVSEGGSNFSLGQRQLLCLARALLRNNKILVLDEATANVDARTDALIQTTIRQKLKNSTVLTIAHRLNTIMDSDKVIVMGAGQILEFDHPHKLLNNPNGYFTKMVMETGTSMTEQLRKVALNAWKERDEDNYYSTDGDGTEVSRL